MINWNSVPSLFVGGNWNGNASLEQEWECRRQLVPETRAEPIRINHSAVPRFLGVGLALGIV